MLFWLVVIVLFVITLPFLLWLIATVGSPILKFLGLLTALWIAFLAVAGGVAIVDPAVQWFFGLFSASAVEDVIGPGLAVLGLVALFVLFCDSLNDFGTTKRFLKSVAAVCSLTLLRMWWRRYRVVSADGSIAYAPYLWIAKAKLDQKEQSRIQVRKQDSPTLISPPKRLLSPLDQR